MNLIARLEQLAARAVKGPWYEPIRFDSDSGGVDWQIQAHGGPILSTVEQSNDKRAKHTAAYVVALLNAAPALIEYVVAHRALMQAFGALQATDPDDREQYMRARAAHVSTMERFNKAQAALGLDLL